MRKSETLVQFSCETTSEYLRNELRRSRGKFFSYIRNRWQWVHYPQKRRLAVFPLNVDIEVSSACQIRCTHCFRQHMDIGLNEFMPLDMYKTIVAECGRHGLFTLKFSMRGEPLLHPDIVEMVRYAKEIGVKEVWINTNGGLITEELARGLIKAGADWITMSFDGLGEQYETVRVPLKYKESLEKLKILRRVRDELKAHTLLNVQSIWTAIEQDPATYVKTMKAIVDRVAYNATMDYSKYTFVPEVNFVCPRLWQRICITAGGGYLKCPSDFKMSEVMGNVSEYSVKEAWDTLSEKHRREHLAGRRLNSPVCAVCHHGAKKVPVTLSIGETKRYDFRYAQKAD
jgi:sulfatase maturation enzyme AslB (radical SAM superfamily)